MAKRRPGVASLRTIVEQRINTLLTKAAQVASEREQDSKKYVKLARALSMRHRIAMGKERKKLFCKSCGSPWIKGFNLEIKKEDVWEIYMCACGAKRKFHS